MTTLDYDAWDAILTNIYQKTLNDNWFKPTDDAVTTGVCVRTAPASFRAVRELNPAVAVKFRSTCVHVVINQITSEDYSINIEHNTRIQILDKGPRDERCLVVWSYNVDTIIEMCHEIDEKLLKYVWRNRPQTSAFSSTSAGASMLDVSAAQSVKASADSEKSESRAPSPPAPAKKSHWWSWRLSPGTPRADPEKSSEEERKLILFDPFYAGCGAALAAYFSTSGVSVLLEEYALDGDMTRFALVATLPIILAISIFFCLQLVGNISLIFGPYHENSKFYSAIKPEPNDESLELVIAPSVYSIKTAMKTYARQGGTSSIFICDDGLQLISEDDRAERMAFYANHNIGWTARPASNMNYGLALSLKLERILAELEAKGEDDTPQESLEEKAMNMAIEEIYQENGQRWKPWAANPKSLRMGEIVLIIDADTVVPEDCFRDAAREMFASPDVAIIQHESDVMQVAHHYFENGITHFTRRINKAISLGCANGAVAPFVGHNAFLRWSAVQDASFVDEDGIRKQWSENNVSEDFNIALRLLQKGYTLRWATYSAGGFKEGVSLTVVDELARWQKYAYGCNEIIFNPLIKWFRKGPISEELRGFVWSKAAPPHYKVRLSFPSYDFLLLTAPLIGMMAYMFSYYGIAAAMVGGVMNYLLLGLAPQIDKFYLHSFEILLACTVVFPGLGNVGFILLEYRLGHRSLFNAIYENLRWIPFFFFFFGGLAIHLSYCDPCTYPYNMTWGSTGKEVERSSFWIEVPRIWQRFRLVYIICFLAIAMIAIMQADFVPA
ncbi:glycosyl transferase family group 2-domain-containing protein [Flagelloscypha sp. PMI_526]|nr:glycosyl transferase family group 2-domain-containing protein [Flagelloscypha sp. PMI_526]